MSQVLQERDGALLTLRLNRPDLMNALGLEMQQELRSVIDAVSTDRDIRAVMITGVGRAFSAGGDLTALLGRRNEIAQSMDDNLNALILAVRNLQIPVLAAVNGAAAGSGFALAMACDIAVAAESTKFHLAFARIGAAMDAGSSYFLTHTIGAARTRALAMLGGTMTAQQGKEWGAVHEVWPDATFDAGARGLAKRLAQGPTRAIGLIKRQVAFAQSHTLEEVLPFEALNQGKAFITKDFEAGVTAFQKGERPKFEGR